MPSITKQARMAARRGRKKLQSIEDVIARDSGNIGSVEDANFEDVPGRKQDMVVAEETAVVRVEADDAWLELYKDGLPFDKDRLASEIKTHEDYALLAIVNIGKKLVWAKEELAHGEFVQWVENAVGYSERIAQWYMSTARSYVENPKAFSFLCKSVAGTSKTKTHILASRLTPEEMERAMQDGILRGRPLDEYEVMSVRQLREALRKEVDRNRDLRDDLEKKDRKLKETEADLDKVRQPEKNLDPESILERHFSDVFNRMGILEAVAIEFAEEVDDEGLVVPEIRDMIAAFLGNIRQKTTNIYQILTPDQVRDVRLHIPHQPKPDDEDAA